QNPRIAADGRARSRSGGAGRRIEFLRRRHPAATDREHVPPPRLLAGLSGAGADHAFAAASPGPAERADGFDSRTWICAWRGARAATEASPTPGHAEGRARFLPAVRRTSDRAHDGALRPDQARDAGVTHQLSEHLSSDLS